MRISRSSSSSSRGLMQTIAKWLMAGAVSYAILQSGLFYTFLSPDNFTLEQNQYPEAAAVEDEKEVASDSRIKPHHGINNKSGKQIANCATYMLPPRSPEELAATMESWRKATDFVLQHRLTFLNEAGLAFHRDKIVEIEQNGVLGMILETGVAKAGSSITFSAVKQPQRCLHLYDTFEGIPEPSGQDDGKDVHEQYRVIQANKQKCVEGKSNCDKNYYGNMEHLMEYDIRQFQEAGYDPNDYNVFFHKGLFDDTVWPGGPIAYGHLDGDWYDSTLGVLKRVAPYLSIGGYFILDDVYDYSGAQDAYSDFFDVDYKWLKGEESKECFTTKDGKHYRLKLDIRGLAQVLAKDDPSLPRCVKVAAKGVSL